MSAANNPPVILFNKDGNTVLVDEKGIQHIVNKTTPVQWIEEYCMLSGSSLKGRIESFRKVTETVQKSAVLVSEISRLMYFPTLSMSDPDCVWVRYDAVLRYTEKSPQETEICFMSGYRHLLKVNRRIVRTQMKRCERYLSILSRYHFHY